MKKLVVILFALLVLAGCGSAVQPQSPSNIKSYDVIDQHGSRHVCFENTDTGALSCG